MDAAENGRQEQSLKLDLASDRDRDSRGAADGSERSRAFSAPDTFEQSLAPRSPRRRRTTAAAPRRKATKRVEYLVLTAVQESRPEEFAALLEKAGVGKFQLLSAPLFLGIFMSEGAEMLLTSVAAAGVQEEFGLSPAQKGSLASFAFLGLGFGTFASGFVADSHGRRAAILGGYTGMCSCGAASVLCWNFLSLALVRFANGVSCGLGIPACMAMLSENFGDRLRAMSFALMTVACTLGEVFTATGALIWMPDLKHGGWREVTGWSTVPSVVLLLLAYALLHESPQWLAATGRLDEAIDIVLKIASTNGRVEGLERVRKAREDEQTESASALSPRSEPSSGSLSGGPSAREVSGIWRPLKALCGDGRLVCSMGICCVMCVAGNVLVFGMSYFWAVALQQSGPSEGESEAERLIVIRCWGFLAALCLLAMMASPLGHRWTILATGVLSALALLRLRVSLGDDAPLVAVGGAALVSSTVFYASVVTFVTETFPTEVRSFGTGTSITVGRVGAIGSPLVIEMVGLRSFLLLGVGLGFLAAFLALLLRETKGLPLEDFCGDAEDDDRDKRPLSPLPLKLVGVDGYAPIDQHARSPREFSDPAGEPLTHEQ